MADTDIAATLTVLERVAKIKEHGVTAATPLKDLGIDSLDLFTVISDLEEQTGRSMSDEDMQRLETVGELARHFFD